MLGNKDKRQQFVELLDDKNLNEERYQEFLEKNSEFIVPYFLLNHHILGNCIITKFPLGTPNKTDFLYVTKSSNEGQIVLIEIESPHCKMFKSNRQQITPTSQFTYALNQIKTWQDFVNDRKVEILNDLKPFITPIGENKIIFKYILIYGRDDELTQAKSNRLNSLGDENFKILTYDSLLRYYDNRISDVNDAPNIIAKVKTYFKLVELNSKYFFVLDYMTNDELEISETHKNQLKLWGYKIDKWVAGEKLGWKFRKVPNDEIIYDTIEKASDNLE